MALATTPTQDIGTKCIIVRLIFRGPVDPPRGRRRRRRVVVQWWATEEQIKKNVQASNKKLVR
jgi:hypothetical protein